MNWLTQWCMDHCDDSRIPCNGCVRRKCLPRLKLSVVTHASERLLEILQCTPGAVTHPNIADRIADYTGATSEQRDTLVHERHHGKYVLFTVGPPPVDTDMDGLVPHNIRAVVALDRDGNELARYSSRREACDAAGCSDMTVRNRCIRKSSNFDEFELLEMTFRFADEWDLMTEEERRIDLLHSVRNEEENKLE